MVGAGLSRAAPAPAAAATSASVHAAAARDGLARGRIPRHTAPDMPHTSVFLMLGYAGM